MRILPLLLAGLALTAGCTSEAPETVDEPVDGVSAALPEIRYYMIADT